MSTLKSLDGLIAARDGILLDCCCDILGQYFKGIPCDAYIETRGGHCGTPNQCSFENSVYFHEDSYCQGGEVQICECHRLRFENNRDAYEGDQSGSDFQQFVLNSSSQYPEGKFTVDSSGITFLATGISSFVEFERLFDDYPTYEDLLNSLIGTDFSDSVTEFQFNARDVDQRSSTRSLNEQDLSVTRGNIFYPTASSKVYFRVSGVLSEAIPWIDNTGTLATNIEQSGFDSYSAFDVSVVPQQTFNSLSDIQSFYCTFNNPCGEPVGKFGVIDARLYDRYPINTTGVYFQRGNDFPDNDEYRQVSGFDGIGRNELCDYPDAYDDLAQCCPQIGDTIGPDQHLGAAPEEGEPDTRVHETTVVYGSRCYVIDESWFLFNRSGRYRGPFVPPDCNVEQDGDCPFGVPQNCNSELFLVSFHPDLTWGPFGSYYSGIEECRHPYSSRSATGIGPFGKVTTVGSWLSTEKVLVEFSFRPYSNFYTGTDSYAEQDIFPGLASNISSLGFENVSFNAVENTWSFELSTTGNTVGTFLDKMNAIRTAVDDCPVFSACAASQDVKNVPLNKVINTSSECFEHWLKRDKGVAGFYLNYDGTNPVEDSGFVSSAHILTPRTFNEMNVSGVRPLEGVELWRGDNEAPGFVPPICKAHIGLPSGHTAALTTNLSDEDPPPRHSPFWTQIQGAEIPVMSVAESGLNREAFNSLTMEVSGADRTVRFVASGPSGVYVTGIATEVGGSGYTISQLATDINNLEILEETFAFATGLTEYDIWVDDQTFWNGSDTPLSRGDGGAVDTDYNYSYKEPLSSGAPYSLTSNSVGNLRAFVRRRCWQQSWASNDDSWELDTQDLCLPMTAERTLASDRIACSLDNTIDRAWIVAFGCGGLVCNEEFFIRAEYCECTNRWDSETCSYVPLAETNPVFSPNLYVCEDAFHPECTICALVKVPALGLVGTEADAINFGWAYEGAGSNITDPFCASPIYTDNPPYDQFAEESTFLLGVDNSTNYMCNEAGGWCQYLDPVNGTRVPESQIPKTWPPTAYVARNAQKLFCASTKFLPPAIGNSSDCAWDVINNIQLMLPPEYVNPATNLPCFFDDPERIFGSPVLRAFFRPALSPLNYDSLTPYGYTDRIGNLYQGPDRFDIDCNTRCCGCGFNCGIQGGFTNGPERCNCTQTIRVNYTTKIEDLYDCCYVPPGGDPNILGACSISICGDIVASPPQIGGIVTTTTTCDVDFELHEEIFRFRPDAVQGVLDGTSCPLGEASCIINYCCACEVRGSCEESFSRNVTCNGDFYDVCGGMPSNACTCEAKCAPSTPNQPTCDRAPNSDEILFVRNIGIPSQNENCGGGGPIVEGSQICACQNDCNLGAGCTAVGSQYSLVDNTSEACLTDGRSVCGVGTVTWSRLDTSLYSGNRSAGASVCPGVARGIYGDNNWNTDTEVTNNGSITYGNQTCQSCSFNGELCTITWEELEEYEAPWECGLPNIQGSGTNGFGVTSANC